MRDFPPPTFYHHSAEVALRPHRQRLTLPAKAGAGSKPIVLEDNKALSAYGLKEGDSIVVKDLGPQISWRAVFCIEYLGPLLIHQFFFLTRLNSSQVMSSTQMYVMPKVDSVTAALIIA